ncbi:MAG: signal peptidase II [Armatimonadetes bacterium]|nr:signal peptidase II [Armatimonadota bacterium]
MALLDQLAKHAVMQILSFGETLPVLPPLLRITLHRNTGIAFGLLGGANALVGILAALTALLLLAFHRDRWAVDRAVLVGLGLVVGGAVGNLLDRVRWGYVVDFIELPYWPIFNLADACIVVGGGLLALRAVRSVQGGR